MRWLRWRWKCWRAGHVVWIAYVDWYNEPTLEAKERWERAVVQRDHISMGKP